ncbi:MAG TPA: ATP-binding protein, partial [Solirubrobacteraceae bacterium]|nr:ATP-binding protein [Solirubrobacteraceae bacterium]
MSAAETPGLLERERELHELEAAIAGALDGRGRSLLLEGPAGIGKTELLRAALAIAGARGARTVLARGSEFERGFGFGVVRQLFEPLVAETPEAERAALLSGAAGLAGDALGDGSEAAGADTAFATLHGLYWLCVNLADRRPLVLAVDDLQWADAASLRWIAFLARRIEGLPVLLVATLRTDGAAAEDRPADELVVHRLAETVRPPALSGEAVR